MRTVARRSVAAASIVSLVSTGCAADVDAPADEPPATRLTRLSPDESGRDVWFDTERGEECQPCATEYNGTRCFPRFTTIDGSQLRYGDPDCTELIAWADLANPSDEYVAYVDGATRPTTLYSIYNVLERRSGSGGRPTQTDSFYLAGNKCAPHKREAIRAHLRISYSIHPGVFALVRE